MPEFQTLLVFATAVVVFAVIPDPVVRSKRLVALPGGHFVVYGR